LDKTCYGVGNGPMEAAVSLVEAFLESGKDGRLGPQSYQLLAQLVKMATAPDPNAQAAGTSAIYSGLVERLCDDFCSVSVSLCNQVLSYLFTLYNETEWGETMRAILNDFGLRTQADILARWDRISAGQRSLPVDKTKIRKLVVLSRVTVGADVAITSIIVNRLVHTFPHRQIIVVSPPRLPEIFGGLPTLEFRPITYPRGGAVSDKLAAWPQIHTLLKKERSGLKPHQLLLFDPDSRYSQLGLLPLVEEESTFYWNSRRTLLPDEGPSLSALINSWLDTILDEKGFVYPSIWLAEKYRPLGSCFHGRLIENGCQRFIVISFGVGNNENKRIPGLFERDLVLALLAQEQDTIILLDTGTGSVGMNRTTAILSAAGQEGINIDFLEETILLEKRIPFSHGIIGFRGSLGAIASLTKGADLFIGYDSACQHLASALGTPAVIIFAGAPHQRFIDRWRPLGKTSSIIIPVGGPPPFSDKTSRTIFSQVLEASSSVFKNIQRSV